MSPSRRYFAYFWAMKGCCTKLLLIQLLLTMCTPYFLMDHRRNLDAMADLAPVEPQAEKNTTFHDSVSPEEHSTSTYDTLRLLNNAMHSAVRHMPNVTLHNLSESWRSTEWASVGDVPVIPDNIRGASCTQLFSNNKVSIARALRYQRHLSYDELLAAEVLQNDLTNCSHFAQSRQYLQRAVNMEERQFPISFSILLYRDAHQAEKLLRAIYRPHNYYCLHVDRKSPLYVHETIRKLSKCFPNVFLASRTLSVEWGWYSVVAPDIACMQDLLRYTDWKYFINLTGQEFPLRTNLELVRILRAYNGANDIQAVKIDGTSSEKIQNRLQWGYQHESEKSHKYRKSPFPYNITWAKGAVHIAVTRDYAYFLTHSDVGKALLEWAKDTAHASEHIFNPLQMSPQLGVPGAYTGPQQTTYTGSRVRFKLWKSNKHVKCQGKYVRDICIISVADLHKLYQSPSMFVNKVHADFHPVVLTCLEQWIFNKTRDDIQGLTSVERKYYENLDFVKNHLPKELSWPYVFSDK